LFLDQDLKGSINKNENDKLKSQSLESKRTTAFRNLTS
jgi:hypothetical protein